MAMGPDTLPTGYAELLEQREDPIFTRPRVPGGTTIDKVNAGEVPAEFLCADGAAEDRVVLYLHGGGYVMPLSNNNREFAAAVSRATGSCVLMPHYRLAPEHPYPAPIQDSVHDDDVRSQRPRHDQGGGRHRPPRRPPGPAGCPAPRGNRAATVTGRRQQHLDHRNLAVVGLRTHQCP